MLKEYLVLGKGVMMADDGLTAADHEKEAEIKEKMQFTIDDKCFLGVCRDCGLYVRATDRHFYLTNKSMTGNITVDVRHASC